MIILPITSSTLALVFGLVRDSVRFSCVLFSLPFSSTTDVSSSTVFFDRLP